MQTEEYTRMFEHEDTYWWFVGRRRLALRLLAQAKQLLLGQTKKDLKVLDIGCGTGAVLTQLSSQHEAIGLDFSQLALEFCGKRGLENLVLANAEQIPMEDNTVDAVVALDIYEHIPNDVRAFEETFRVLRPGGHLVLSVPAFRFLWGPHDVALMHFRRYTKREMRRRLEDAGFKVERISYSVFFLFPALVMTRLAAKLRRGDAKVQIAPVPNWTNRLFIKLQEAEAKWIQRTGGFPWGSSVVAVAKKPT
ncbi:MAG TPA: methyltransferase domain-containing protein [Fimbriimonadaceae bacterium]|nr:methyltransferase domain-containing protein [Fimbriimonadaceae bacterium]